MGWILISVRPWLWKGTVALFSGWRKRGVGIRTVGANGHVVLEWVDPFHVFVFRDDTPLETGAVNGGDSDWLDWGWLDAWKDNAEENWRVITWRSGRKGPWGELQPEGSFSSGYLLRGFGQRADYQMLEQEGAPNASRKPWWMRDLLRGCCPCGCSG